MSSSSFTVAVIQAGSVIGDTAATMDKLAQRVAEAAAQGAKLGLLPEAFIGGYPKGLDFGARLGSRSLEGRDEFRAYFDAAIEEHGPEAARLGEIAREAGLYLVVGVIERDGGTLYCSVFYYGPDGAYLGKHRKLMPTGMERLIWGFGDGSTLPVLDTPLGKLGAAICWENYMPLLRSAMYGKGVQLYCAPTVDDRDTWLPTMRTIAIEGRCFVISACQFMTTADFPQDHAAYDPAARTLIRGGSCVVDPLGRVLAGPLFEQEGVLLADIDIDQIARGKFDLDVVGHYARPDVFSLIVDETPRAVVRFETRGAGADD